jgi:hypothetical protein
VAPDLDGRVVVVVGEDGARVAASVAALEARGARVGAFVDDVSTDAGGAALAEMVAELFGDPGRGGAANDRA